MPGQFVGPRQAILYGNVRIPYLLYDAFLDTRAAGAVNGTPSTPPDNIVLNNAAPARTVTDANSKLSIAGGVASFATAGVGAGDPGLWYPAITRGIGRALIGTIRIAVAATGSAALGWDSTAAGTILDSIIFGGGGLLYARVNGTAIELGTFTATPYSVACVLRSVGVYYFIKGGVFTNWTLIWVSLLGSGATLPAVETGAATTDFTADNIRVPVSLFIPTPLAYSTFGA